MGGTFRFLPCAMTRFTTHHGDELSVFYFRDDRLNPYFSQLWLLKGFRCAVPNMTTDLFSCSCVAISCF